MSNPCSNMVLCWGRYPLVACRVSADASVLVHHCSSSPQTLGEGAAALGMSVGMSGMARLRGVCSCFMCWAGTCLVNFCLKVIYGLYKLRYLWSFISLIHTKTCSFALILMQYVPVLYFSLFWQDIRTQVWENRLYSILCIWR